MKKLSDELQRIEGQLEAEKNCDKISFYEGYIKGIKFAEKSFKELLESCPVGEIELIPSERRGGVETCHHKIKEYKEVKKWLEEIKK